MARPKRELIKITTNINSNVLYYLDKYAEDNGITRTTALTMLLTVQLVSLGYGDEHNKSEMIHK